MFRLEFNCQKKSLILWSVTVSFVIILFMSLYPSMHNIAMQDIINAKMDALPESVLKIFSINQLTDFSNISNYFAYVIQYIVYCAVIYASILGASVLIKEESSKNIEYIYSHPISRKKIAFEKFLAILLTFTIFIFLISVVSAICVAIFIKDKNDLLPIMINIKSVFSTMYISGLSFMSLSFLLSSIIKPSINPASVSLLLFFSSFMISTMSKIVEKLSFLKYFCILTVSDPSKVINGDINFLLIGIYLLLSMLLIYLTLIIYSKKDIRI